MILFPAIDIKNGECVRLKLGDLNNSKTYNKDPLAQAKIFESIGFKWIHIVDLDAAVTGKSKNREIIDDIVNYTNLSVQLGGGIRDFTQIDYWLKIGVQKLVLGTISVNDIELVKAAAKRYPKQIIIALDTKEENIFIEGWTKNTGINVFDLVDEYKGQHIDAILHTDINRDGMMEGLNFSASRNLAKKTDIPVILSGGLKSIADIKTLKLEENKKFRGAIIGKAIYEKKINPLDAIKLINQ
tara:strand:+ start:33978 stop:34703 length:726 start_codon:yes stop_codon:yes gene_type:complete